MEEERSREVNQVVAKALGLLVVVGLVIAIGTYLVVHLLGLNGGGSTSAPDPGYAPPSPLPTAALPGTTPSASPGASHTATGATSAPPDNKAAKGLRLQVSPQLVSPMTRINLTGTYAHHDDMALEIQRWEDGTWADFPIQAQVDLGTFATQIETRQVGVNRFRVYDPSAKRASNVVSVTVQ